MKKILLLLVVSFLLVSCGNAEKQGVTEEASDIVVDYVDTLESTVSDAHAVADLMNQKQDSLVDTLEGIR